MQAAIPELLADDLLRSTQAGASSTKLLKGEMIDERKRD
jgi:hypothetical protein